MEQRRRRARRRNQRLGGAAVVLLAAGFVVFDGWRGGKEDDSVGSVDADALSLQNSDVGEAEPTTTATYATTAVSTTTTELPPEEWPGGIAQLNVAQPTNAENDPGDYDTADPEVRGIVIENMLLTSALAVGDHSQLEYTTRSGTAQATWLGHDPFIDLAVFEASSGAGQWSGPVCADPAVGDAITLQPSGLPGTVLSVAEPSMSSDGHPLVGTIRTTVMAPHGRDEQIDAAPRPGELAINEDGEAVGMVIASENYLVELAPISDLLEAGHRIAERGWPAAHRLWATIEDSPNGVAVIALDDSVDRPAEPAFMAGDVIIEVGSSPTGTVNEVIEALRSQPADQPINVTVVRDGKDLEVHVPPYENATPSPEES